MAALAQGREYRQGDHICVAYASPEEQLAVAVAFIADGLHKGERCLFAASSRGEIARFRTALTRTGVRVDDRIANHALILLTKDRAHLQGGRFDSERMLKMLSAEVEASLNLGFTGLRTCGDMSWLLDGAPGSEQVIEYEAILNQFFPTVRALGMCLYDRERLPHGLLAHALDTHPLVVTGGQVRDNPYFGGGIEGGSATVSRKLASLEHGH